MRRTIAFAIDFVLDVLDYSPDEPSIPLNETDLRLQPTADPMMKDIFCLVLWNDDKHSFEEVKTVILELSGKGSGPEREKEVAGMVRRLEDEGRVMVDMNVVNTNPAMHGQQHAKLLEMAHSMAQIDMGVTIRRAYDTFCEQVAAVIIEWLLDISRARVGSDNLILREVLAQELLMPRRRDAFAFGKSNSATILPISAVTIKEIPNPTRLDYMFVYHGKLWKKLRLSLKEIYASIISLSRTHKLTIGESPQLQSCSILKSIQLATMLGCTTASWTRIYFWIERRRAPSSTSLCNCSPFPQSRHTSSRTIESSPGFLISLSISSPTLTDLQRRGRSNKLLQYRPSIHRLPSKAF